MGRIATRRSGFSLVEIILATVILSVVSVVVLRYATMPGERAKKQSCDATIGQLQLLAEQYRADTGSLPAANLSQLADERYLGQVPPRCPVDDRAYVLDRRTGDIRPHAHP